MQTLPFLVRMPLPCLAYVAATATATPDPPLYNPRPSPFPCPIFCISRLCFHGLKLPQPARPSDRPPAQTIHPRRSGSGLGEEGAAALAATLDLPDEALERLDLRLVSVSPD